MLDNLRLGKTCKPLTCVHVRAETSKVCTSRTFLCRNEQYFERLRETAKPTNVDELVFTMDDENQITQHTMLYHWHKMIELIDIADREIRDLGPCSLRHFMIM